MTIQTSDNKFGVAQWIVDPVAGLGTHTTIQAAITSASSGETIFIRPGTYTEDITLKAGVDLVSFGNEGETPNVTIVGKCTATFDGSASISGIRLQTNGDYLLSVTGSNGTVLKIFNCYLNITDNDGIEFSSSSSSATILFASCYGSLGTTGIKIYDHSSAGTLRFEQSIISNLVSNTTASTISAGVLSCFNSFFASPHTTSGTANAQIYGTSISNVGINTTMLTIGGSGGGFFNLSGIASGSAVSMTVNSTFSIYNSTFQTTNGTVIDGSGTIDYSGLTFSGNNNITTTTKTGRSFLVGNISFDNGVNELNYYETGGWTPTLLFGGTASGQGYNTRSGTYARIGRVVYAFCEISLSNKGSTTGAATISGLPFASNINTTGTTTWGLIDIDVAGGYYYVSANIALGGQVLTLQENGDNVAIAALTDADFSNTSSITISIQYMVA